MANPVLNPNAMQQGPLTPQQQRQQKAAEQVRLRQQRQADAQAAARERRINSWVDSQVRKQFGKDGERFLKGVYDPNSQQGKEIAAVRQQLVQTAQSAPTNSRGMPDLSASATPGRHTLPIDPNSPAADYGTHRASARGDIPVVGGQFVDPRTVSPDRVNQLNVTRGGQTVSNALRDGAGRLQVDQNGGVVPQMVMQRPDLQQQLPAMPGNERLGIGGIDPGTITSSVGPELYAPNRERLLPVEIFDIAMQMDEDRVRNQNARDAQAMGVLNQGQANTRSLLSQNMDGTNTAFEDARAQSNAGYDQGIASLADGRDRSLADMNATEGRVLGDMNATEGRVLGEYDSMFGDVDQLGQQELARIEEQRQQGAAASRAALNRRGLGSSTLLATADTAANRTANDATLGIRSAQADRRIGIRGGRAGAMSDFSNRRTGAMSDFSGRRTGTIGEAARGIGDMQINKGAVSANSRIGQNEALNQTRNQLAASEVANATSIASIVGRDQTSPMQSGVLSLAAPQAAVGTGGSSGGGGIGSLVGGIAGTAIGAFAGGVGAPVGAAAGSYLGGLFDGKPKTPAAGQK